MVCFLRFFFCLLKATAMQYSGDFEAGDDNTSSASDYSPNHQRNNTITGGTVRTMSRRQRKNRKTLINTNDDVNTIEKENKEPVLSSSSSSSVSSTTQRKASSSKTRSTPSKKHPTNILSALCHRIRVLSPPLREYLKLNLPESMLVMLMKKYTLTQDRLNQMGYPFEYTVNKAAIYKYGLNDYIIANTTKPEMPVGFDVNAQEFVPKINSSLSTRFLSKDLIIVNKNDCLLKRLMFKESGDSGQASGSSSPASCESDTNDIADVQFTSNDNSLDGISIIKYYADFQKTCIRCRRLFAVTDDGQYLTEEHCFYHWGKRERVYNKNSEYVSIYTCCGNDQLSNGCSFGSLHVWTGIKDGFNGPFDRFISTKTLNIENSDGNYGAYALDCEMSFTSTGLEATKVTLVNPDGQMAYEKLIRPTETIIDYNTRFSGITEKDLSGKNGSVKSLDEVQQDLLQMISAETILIGHALDNDLRVLKIIHKTVIDTSNLFPHDRGFPYRRSLKSITKSILKRDIQMMDAGHSSFEDSRASLELLLWLIRNELRSTI